MRKREQNGADFKDIEILSEKIAREVAAMDGGAVDVIYEEIRLPDDPAARVRDLAANAARQHREGGDVVPEHVQAALDAPGGTRTVGMPAVVEPVTAIEVRESALVPVRELCRENRARGRGQSGGLCLRPGAAAALRGL